MDEQNPYAPPRTEVTEAPPSDPQQVELADRGIRLLGAIIDGFLLMFVLLPAMWFGGYFKAAIANEVGFGLLMLWTAISFGIFVLVQGFPLYTWGQTWAKRLLDIRIVDMDGYQPPFWKLILLRYGVPQLLGIVPVVNILFMFANPLFIFGEERRCLHDRIAGTRVINVHKR